MRFSRCYLEITNRCNLACSFCPKTKRPARTLTAEEFRLLAGKLRAYTDYLYLHVMGEPLLHPALGEILDECDRLGLRVCVTTNGVLLPSRLAVLRGRRCLHKVSVSLQSFEGNGGDGGLEAQFCYGLRQQIAVLCDGTVVPCCLDGEGRLALGNLLAQELDGILDSPRAQAIREGFDRRRPSESLCRRCGFARRFNK